MVLYQGHCRWIHANKSRRTHVCTACQSSCQVWSHPCSCKFHILHLVVTWELWPVFPECWQEANMPHFSLTLSGSSKKDWNMRSFSHSFSRNIMAAATGGAPRTSAAFWIQSFITGLSLLPGSMRTPNPSAAVDAKNSQSESSLPEAVLYLYELSSLVCTPCCSFLLMITCLIYGKPDTYWWIALFICENYLLPELWLWYVLWTFYSRILYRNRLGLNHFFAPLFSSEFLSLFLWLKWGVFWDGCLFQVCGLKFLPGPCCNQVIGAKKCKPHPTTNTPHLHVSSLSLYLWLSSSSTPPGAMPKLSIYIPHGNGPSPSQIQGEYKSISHRQSGRKDGQLRQSEMMVAADHSGRWRWLWTRDDSLAIN